MRRLAAAACLGALWLGVGCLDPLPAPTSCDAPARPVDGQCVPCDPPARWIDDECVPCDPPSEFVEDTCKECPALPAYPMHRCIPDTFIDYGAPPDGCAANDGVYERFECLMGEGFACDCPIFDLADDEPLCVAEGACPSFVTKRFGETASCGRVLGDQVAWAEIVPTDGCGCGCFEALVECDGRGYAFGYIAGAEHPLEVMFDALRLPIGGEFPTAGTFGVYVRMRGFALPFFVLALPTLPETAWAFFTSGEFTEAIGYANDEGINSDLTSGQAYAYSAQQGPPSELYVVMETAPANTEAFGMFEIDCVIPFALPE